MTSSTDPASGYVGFLNINKPTGITSHDVVNRVRRCMNIKRVGHTGTLDPMASGVLPIALNRACKLIRFLPSDKIYLAEILLGTSTDTDDITGTVISSVDPICSPADISSALSSFTGEIQQIPPRYSAIHFQGKRLYQFAREGISPGIIPPRTVTIHHLEVLKVNLPVVQVRIICSAGTYIRALARDLGLALKCGGCLNSLLRERAGSFDIKDTISLEQLEHAAHNNHVLQLLIPPSHLLPEVVRAESS